MKPMMYKGYSAKIEYSDEDTCFVGRVAGIQDILTFHGETVAEMRLAFEETLDFYLASCAERGEIPNKPYSGKLLLRLPPEIHASVATSASVSGKSINQWAVDVLAGAANQG